MKREEARISLREGSCVKCSLEAHQDKFLKRQLDLETRTACETGVGSAEAGLAGAAVCGRPVWREDRRLLCPGCDGPDGEWGGRRGQPGELGLAHQEMVGNSSRCW